MAVKVYVVTEREAIDFIVDNDIEGFKACLNEDDTLYFDEPKFFDTEEEALAFCDGLGCGSDERANPTTYPLRSFEEVDQPFINAIENY